VRGGKVFVAWQEFASLGNDDAGRIMMARFSGRPRKVRLRRPRRRPGRRRQVDAVDRVRRVAAGRRLGRRARPRPEASRSSTSTSRAACRAAELRPGGPRRRGDADALALHNDNKWAPSLAAQKKLLLVAWADFRSYQWDIYSARSFDAGLTWQPNVRVDDSAVFERVNERPSVAIDRLGTCTSRGRTSAHGSPIRTSSTPGARSRRDVRRERPDRRLEGPASIRRRHAVEPVVAEPRRRRERRVRRLAGQPLGNNDVFFTRSFDFGQTFQPTSASTTPATGHSEQTRPSLTFGGKGAKRVCYVAWEDSRTATATSTSPPGLCPN
jgi:hypothetical protein